MNNLLVEFKDDVLTGCRLVDKDSIDACNSIFIRVRVNTILHRTPHFYGVCVCVGGGGGGGGGAVGDYSWTPVRIRNEFSQSIVDWLLFRPTLTEFWPTLKSRTVGLQ